MTKIQKFIEDRNRSANAYNGLRPTEKDVIESINTIRLIYSDESFNKSYFNIFDQDVRVAKLVDIRKDKIVAEILAQKLTNSEGKEESIPYLYAKVLKVTQEMLNDTTNANYGYYNQHGLNVPHYRIYFDTSGITSSGTFNVIADISGLKDYPVILLDYTAILVKNLPVYSSYRSTINKNVENFFIPHDTKIYFNLVDDKKVNREIHVAGTNRFFDSAWIYNSTIVTVNSGNDIDGVATGYSNADSSIWGPIPHINIYNTKVQTFNFCSDTSEPNTTTTYSYGTASSTVTLTQKAVKGMHGSRRIGSTGIDNGKYANRYFGSTVESIFAYYTFTTSGNFTELTDYRKGKSTYLGPEYWHYNNLTVSGLETVSYPYVNATHPIINEIETLQKIPSSVSGQGYLKRATLNFFNCDVTYRPNIVYQYSSSLTGAYSYESTNIPAYYYNCNITYTPVSTYVYKGKTTKYIPSYKTQGILLYPYNTSYLENCILTIYNPNKIENINDFEYKNTLITLKEPIGIPYVSLDNSIFTGKDLINLTTELKFYNPFDKYKQPYIRYTKDYYLKSHLLFENCGVMSYDSEDLSTVMKMPADNIFINSALYYGFDKTRGLEVDNSLLSFSSGPVYSDNDANTYYLANKVKIANSPNFLNKIWKTTLNEYIVRIHPQFTLNQSIYVYNDTERDLLLVRPKTDELKQIFQALNFEYNLNYQAYLIPPSYMLDKYYILLLEDIDGNKSSLIYDPVLGFVGSTFTDKSNIFNKSALVETYNKSATMNAIALGVNELSTDYNDEVDYKYTYGSKLIGVYTVYKKIISDIEYNQNYNTMMVNDSIQTIELEEITKRFVEN